MCVPNLWKWKNVNPVRSERTGFKKKENTVDKNGGIKDIKRALSRKALFNAQGDTELVKRRMIGGNTTNLNDFNNIKYSWTSAWYR